MVSVLARGSKKEKSAFGGALDLFYLGTARVSFRGRSSLKLLIAFRVERAFPELRAEMSRFYAACHLAEILLGFTREEEPLPRLFDLVREGLEHLPRAAPAQVPALLAALDLQALRELGFAPSLSRCAHCGNLPPSGPAFLSASEGGLLCQACRSLDPACVRTTAGALGALRSLARLPLRRASRVRLGREDSHRIREYLTRFAEWRLERRLRTARFL